ncbi:MAG TPA: hypothetical protein VGL72_19730 [Bryobacteraceae bacterium]
MQVSRGCLVFALAFLMGCAARQTAPTVYRLVNTGPARLLVPPGVSDPALAQRTFDFAPQEPPGRACRPTTDVIRVEPHRHFLRLTVDRDALLAHPAPWLMNWTSALEAKGCLSPGEGAILAQRIVESVPLNPLDTQRLLHGGGGVTGYQDLPDGSRLKLVSAILRAGAGPGASALATDSVTGNDKALTLTVRASDDFLGYELSWYVVAGSHIVFDKAESHIGDRVTTSPQPRTNYFHFPASAAYYRLFYFTRVSQADHNVAILAAASRQELDRQTPVFNTDPEACGKAPANLCVTLPKEVALTTYRRIIANGALLDIPGGSNVAAALREAGIRQPETVLPTLNLRRPFHGVLTPVEFDRRKPDILTLPLSGGEQLRW